MYQPILQITPDLLNLITEATELREWIARASIDVAWLPLLQRETEARLAHSSTAIEGNPLTLPEIEALARGEEIAAQEKFKREVINYLAAMRWVWGRKGQKTISESDLMHLHEMLTRDLLPKEKCGRYKALPNRVVDGKGRLIYLPPPPEKAQPLTLELLDWLNSSESEILHPVLTSSIAHHRLVSIHPFSDGNGRIARALAAWILFLRGFDTQHLFALDEYFEQNQQLYYDKIQQARDLDDNLSWWLEYCARGVVETLKRTRSRIESLRITAKASKVTLTKRQEDLLRWMQGRGRVRSPEIEKALKITRSRINQILKPLIEAGLVLREGQRRGTTYRMA